MYNYQALNVKWSKHSFMLQNNLVYTLNMNMNHDDSLKPPTRTKSFPKVHQNNLSLYWLLKQIGKRSEVSIYENCHFLLPLITIISKIIRSLGGGCELLWQLWRNEKTCWNACLLKERQCRTKRKFMPWKHLSKQITFIGKIGLIGRWKLSLSICHDLIHTWLEFRKMIWFWVKTVSPISILCSVCASDDKTKTG